MKWEFKMTTTYDTTSGTHILDIPDGWEFATITRWPVPGEAIEMWIKRPYVKKQRHSHHTKDKLEVE
jgi:hypothetical protein